MEVTLVGASRPQMMPVSPEVSPGFPGPLTVSAPSTGAAIPKTAIYTTYQLVSAAAATAVVEATNDAATAAGTSSNWVLLGTISLAAAGTDGFATSAAWRWVRARVTAATAATFVLQGG